MSVRLEHEKVTSVPVQAMHDGEIAIVEAWPLRPNRVDSIFQRCGDHLMEIGRSSGSSVDCVWGSTAITEPVKGCRVRILEAGEKIVIS